MSVVSRVRSLQNNMNPRSQKREVRRRRIRARITGTAVRPRLAVFRSNKHLYAQVIDDTAGHTLVSAHDGDVEKGKGKTKESVNIPEAVGMLVAKRALEKKIASVVFDRGGYQYIGTIKALADGARKGGLSL